MKARRRAKRSAVIPTTAILVETLISDGMVQIEVIAAAYRTVAVERLLGSHQYGPWPVARTAFQSRTHSLYVVS